MKAALISLLLITLAGAAEVDRTDPQAVASAFLDAIAAGRDDDARALLAEDKGLKALEAVSSLVAGETSGQSPRAIFSLMPGFGAGWRTFETGERKELADGLEIALTVRTTSPLKLILTKDATGRYAVDLRRSVIESLPPGNLMRLQFKQLGDAVQYTGADFSTSYWQGFQTASQLQQALQAFADEQGRYPIAEVWMDELAPYVEGDKPFACPAHPDEEYSFAFNREQSEQKPPTNWEQRQTTLLLVSVAGNQANATFAPGELGKLPPRYGKINLLMYATGQPSSLPEGQTPAQMADDKKLSDGCRERLRRLVEAAKKYAAEHDGALPPAATWTDDLTPYLQADRQATPEPLVCPAGEGPCTYAINQELAGKKLVDLPNYRKRLLFIEVESGPPNRAVPADYRGAARHYADGMATAARAWHLAYLNGWVTDRNAD